MALFPPWRPRLRCALVVLLLCLAAGAATARTSAAVPAVEVEVGVLPEAKSLGRLRQRAGEWAYNFNPGDEAALFADEDTASQLWQQRKAELRRLQAHRQQQQQKRRAEEEATGGEEGTPITKPGEGRRDDAGASAAAKYFTERNVARRQTERLRVQSKYNMSVASEAAAARASAAQEVAALWQRVSVLGTGDSAAEQRFFGLAERHFAHTFVDTKPTPSGVPMRRSRLVLLRTPFVLDTDVLPNIERELGHVRDLWKRRRRSAAAAGGDAGGGAAAAVATSDDTTAEETEVQLRQLSEFLMASRLTATQLTGLVTPVAEAAASWVAATLTATREAIVGNDESTEAKRAALKQLLKQQARLREAKRTLEQHVKVYQGVTHRGQLPNAEANLFALELLAKERLGDEMAGVLDAIPFLSTSAPLTALTEAEWRTHVVGPVGVALLITAACTWLCEEVKQRCLSSIREQRLRQHARPPLPGTPSSRARVTFKLLTLLEIGLQFVTPLLAVRFHVQSNLPWALSAVALMRLSQRAVTCGLLLSSVVVNYAVAKMARRLFIFIDPRSYHRRLAKTK